MRWLPTLVVAMWCITHSSVAEYRLPGDIVPMHYDLKYAFDVDPAFKYNYLGYFAVVEISINVKRSTDKIVLHAKDILIRQDMILIRGPQNLNYDSFSILNDTLHLVPINMLTIIMPKTMNEGENYTVIIPFSGTLKPGLDGIFMNSYVNNRTKAKEYFVATLFEGAAARKSFPCFDEPTYKATFTITIGHHKNFNAISNMPKESSSADNAIEGYYSDFILEHLFKKSMSDFVWDTFKKSLPMSTYMVGFVVSNFSYVESPQDLSDTRFRIYARNDAINQTAFAAQMGPKALSYFEQWFNVSFPLPKQDMIALPDTAGAMENWGLVSFRETELLFDEKQSSFLNKERATKAIANAMAHQLFGNLVNLKWWSDLWLNEGFATFAASAAVAHVEPLWHADRSYAVDSMLAVLTLDALESSHPVADPVDGSRLVSEIFDDIFSKKGHTLVRMMSMFLGDEVFNKAIKNYLVKYSYSTAEQDDLWRELTAVSQEYGVLTRNVSVKEVMDTWTTQTGYPLLTVTRDYTDKSLTISQKRYYSLTPASTMNASWWVPLSVLSEGEVSSPPAPAPAPAPLQWVGAHEGVAEEHRGNHTAGPDQWLLVNQDMIAPYRVNYDAQNWQLLSNALNGANFTSVPVLGRVQLMSDVFALAWTNHLDYSTAFGLSSYLRKEHEYLPLSAALEALGKIETVLKRTPDYDTFQKFIRSLIRGTYERVGGLEKRILDGQDLNSVKMQVTTSAWACRAKVPGCEESAVELFQRWMDTPDPDEHNPIPQDLRRTVYCAAISRGSEKQWHFALRREQNANVAAVREDLLSALTCTRNTSKLTMMLKWTVATDSELRMQDVSEIIRHIIRSTEGYKIAKEFIYEKIYNIYDTYKNQGRGLGDIIKTLLEQFTSQSELDEFLVWRKKFPNFLKGFNMAMEQGIEQAKVNIDWMTKNRGNVVDKLYEYAVKNGVDTSRTTAKILLFPLLVFVIFY